MAHINRKGLTLLWPRQEETVGQTPKSIANIILVHDLGGHPKTTWSYSFPQHQSQEKKHRYFRSILASRHSGNKLVSSAEDEAKPGHPGVFWPEEFLPHDLPNARIWTYGYDADGIGELLQNTDQGGFLQGQTLVASLEKHVDDEIPIAFIAHGLGGIIVKDAVCRSEAILKRTLLVIFLGTPHQASNEADWHQIGLNIARLSNQNPNNKVLAGSLKTNTEALENLNVVFKSIAQQHCMHIHSFQEAHSVSGIKGLHGKVVNDFSSRLDLPRAQEVVETINADHIHMTKYPSGADDGYRALAGVLKVFVNQEVFQPSYHEGLLHLTEEEKNCIRAFSSDYETDFQNIPRRHPGTCEWVLSHDDFVDFVESREGRLLWISGEPGVGKTVLAKYLAEFFVSDSAASNKSLYFFFSDRDPKRKTAGTMLRTLIDQCLKYSPGLIQRYVLPEYHVHGDQAYRSLPILWRIFVAMSQDVRLGVIYCVLDGLDECEESSRNEVLQLIGHYASEGSATDSDSHELMPMKLIITSRPYETIRVLLFPYAIIRLQGEIEEGYINHDITQYVASEIENIANLQGYPDFLGQEVAKIVSNHAGSIFLWVYLMIKLLKRTPAADVRAVLRSFPRSLDEIYDMLINSIPDESVDSVCRILEWVMWAFRPLTVQELGVACNISPRLYLHSSITGAQKHDIREDLDLCSHILEVHSNGAVHFVHQTTREYLMKDATEDSRRSRLKSSHWTAHEEMARACLIFLSNEELTFGPLTPGKHQTSQMSPKNSNDEYLETDDFQTGNSQTLKEIEESSEYKNLLQQNPFLEYAASHWYLHLLSLHDPDVDLQLWQLVRRFLRNPIRRSVASQIQQVAAWTVYNRRPYGIKTEYCTDESPLHILIRAGLEHYAEHWATSEDIDPNITDSSGRTALHLAAERGYVKLVRALLQNGADINTE
ncbi:hypothetical protein K432DRAFT_340248, partial [Lepidopterella palustris CBS 459.81]